MPGGCDALLPMPYMLGADVISGFQSKDAAVVSCVVAISGSRVFVTVVSCVERIAGRLSVLCPTRLWPRQPYYPPWANTRNVAGRTMSTTSIGASRSRRTITRTSGAASSV